MLVFTGFVCVYAPTWLWGKGPTAQTLHTVDVLFVLCCFVYLMEHMRIKGLEQQLSFIIITLPGFLGMFMRKNKLNISNHTELLGRH